MISFEEALRTTLSLGIRTGTARVPLAEACNRILAEDVVSDLDMPPFDKSAVDGYACRLDDAGSTGPLRVLETLPAGRMPAHAVEPGTCTRIMTGAVVPPGAECVVMVEDSEATGPNHVRFTRPRTALNICYRAEDIRKGERVLQAGCRITPAHVAVLAAMGVAEPLVAGLPTVGILSTGDEIVEPGQVPNGAQIRNSNAWQLLAQAAAVPAKTNYYGIIPDDPSALSLAIDRACSENDVVILTGGVSMGDFDFVPAKLKDAGIEILFKSVAIQPGRPTVFGYGRDTSVFGLPGNPVSAYILFEVLVKPFLLAMMGFGGESKGLRLPMGSLYRRRNTARKGLVPVVIRDGEVFPVEYHGSAHINAYTMAEAVLEVETGVGTIEKGETVHVRPL